MASKKELEKKFLEFLRKKGITPEEFEHNITHGIIDPDDSVTRKVTNEYILDIIRQSSIDALKGDRPEFSLDDLIGKTIVEHRNISKKDGVMESHAIIFSDGTFLVSDYSVLSNMDPTLQNGIYLTFLYYDRSRIRYSRDLFGDTGYFKKNRTGLKVAIPGEEDNMKM